MITGRLVGLRPMQVADEPMLTELANSPSIRSMVVGWDWMVSPDGQAEWIGEASKSGRTHRLTIVDKETMQPIGITGFWDIDWHNRSALSAVKLLPDSGLRGAGSDAIMLMSALAFREVGLHRLYGSILPFNEASLRAYVGKCGWVVEGEERQSIFRDGTWHNLIRVAILRSDFEDLDHAAEYGDYVFPRAN